MNEKSVKNIKNKNKNRFKNRFRHMLAIALIAVAIVSAYQLHNSLTPKVKSVSSLETAAVLKTSFSGYSVVTEDNPVWKKGERLKDLPLYITTVSSLFNFTFSAELAAVNGTAKNISVLTEVLYFSKYGDDIIWSKRYSFGRDSGREKCKNSMSIDIADIQGRIVSIEKELGYKGKTEAKIVNTVSYSVVHAGKEIKGVKKFEVPITINPNTYIVETKRAEDSSIGVNTVKKVAVKPSIGDFGPPLVTLLASTGSLFAIAFSDRIVGRRDPLKKYKAIISSGKVREFSGNVVDVKSIEDLHNIAIDTGERIIQDGESFLVIHGNTAYVFRSSD